MVDGVKILAVDDVDMNLEMIECMLAGTGSNILKAINGADALHVLKDNPDTDIILLDLTMPVMDGYETLREIKHCIDWKDIPVIVLTADSKEVNQTLALGANDFLAKPCDSEELRLRVMNHVHTKKLSDFANHMNQVLEAEVTRKTTALQEALKLSQETEYEISIRLGRAAEFRDKETGMHIRRISEMSYHLGKLAGFSEEKCVILNNAAALHDVGKIGIPDSILLKPGRLDPDEFEIMKRHTTIGGEILADADRYSSLDAGAIVAMQHHERWDGSGYPMGLKGHGIHEFARIVAIVDVFDALSSERPYKQAYPLDRVIGIMKEERGRSFDPDLLDLFFNYFDRFVEIKEKIKG